MIGLSIHRNMEIKKKVFLHIGYSKTGTTALQHFLFDHRKMLEEHSVLYPVSCMNNHNQTNHHNLSHSLLVGSTKPFPSYNDPKNYGETPDFYWNKIIDEIETSTCKTIILSSEAFIRFRGIPHLMQKVNDYLKDFDLKIICYIRRQDYLFESNYNHKVKASNSIEPFEKDMESKIKNIDYYRDLMEWATIVGKENMIVRIYSKENLPGGIIPDFLSCINVTFHSTEKGYNLNLKIPTRFIPLKLYLNKHRQYQQIGNKRINEAIIWMGNHVKKQYSLLTSGQRIQILNKYTDSNTKLATEFLDGQYPFTNEINDYKTISNKFIVADLLFFYLTLFFLNGRRYFSIR